MRAVIVVPTIREECLQRFLEAWHDEFAAHRVIVVEDNPAPTFRIAEPNVSHFSWHDIGQELGTKAWIIPRRTDCIRSYGYWKAWREQPDMVVTLDDDCYPLGPGFLGAHWAKLTSARSGAWVSTTEGIQPRGMPYFRTERQSECVLNHGLWENVPDFDSVSQLGAHRYPRPFSWRDQVIPHGMYFPMCGMNLAFKPKVIPALYFLLMGQGYPYDRFGDIWSGIIFKRICDHLGYAVTSGSPAVHHDRASNVWVNLRKEANALEANEVLWEAVDSFLLRGDSFRECYLELAEKLPMRGDYWDLVKQAMREWTDLFF